MEDVKADIAADATCREESSLCNRTAHETSRGCTHRCHAAREPQEGTGSAAVDISEAVRAKVAGRMRGATVMDLVTS